MSKIEIDVLVSVGIPFYNAEKYLNFAILSVLAQTYKNWELILIDDGSTDNSLEIAKKYSAIDSRIRVISDGKNKKLPYRLNQLIDESKYEYVARMDADDVMHPERLKRQLNFLEENQAYDLVSTGLVSIDNNNQVKGFRSVSQLYNDFSIAKISYPIVHPSVMARKSWYSRNRYSEDFPRAEDFELWSRSSEKKDLKMAVLPDLLMFYREEGSLKINNIIDSYKDVSKIYTKYSPNGSYSKDIVKLKMKIIVAKLLFYSGNLQKLASRRNSMFVSKKYKNELQDILNKIVNAD